MNRVTPNVALQLPEARRAHGRSLIQPRASAAELGRQAATTDMPSLDELLIFAARTCNDELVRERIAAGADVNHVSERYGSALMTAAGCGDATVVSTLLSHGGDPNLADGYGRGPLEYALRFGHDEVAQLLLQAQARLQPHSRDIFQTLLTECLRRLGQRRRS